MAESYITRKGGGGGVRKYSTWIVQADNGAKYTSYNGFDVVTNPTPNLNNLPFNRWILNNSVSGEVVLNNLVLTSNGSFNAAQVPNEALLNFVRQAEFSAGQSGSFFGVTGVSPFAYYAPRYNSAYGYNALASMSLNLTSTPISFYLNPSYQPFQIGFAGFITYVPELYSIYFVDNGYLYKGGVTGGSVLQQAPFYIGGQQQVAYSNGFLYVGQARKVHASNLVNVAVSSGDLNVNGTTNKITANANFVFIAGRRLGSLHANNLTNTGFFTANVPDSQGIFGLAADNDFVYYSGRYATLTKAWANNLVTVATASGGISDALSITLDKDFLYIPSYSSGITIRKYFKSNLTFVGATNNAGTGSQFTNAQITGNHMYALTYSGSILQYNTSGQQISTTSLFSINNAKE
jgi:hypothetical protein